MLYLLSCLVGLVSWTSGSEPCTETFDGQYQCWDTDGILKEQSSVCIRNEQKCADQQRCHCPWCDDQWNCPTFEDCQANGGFLCSHSLSPDTQQVWACIPQEWACDGIWDCPSGEDESREFCDVGKCDGNHNLTYWYQCSDTGRCIDILTVGDGEIDCVNGEDEDEDVLVNIGELMTTGAVDEMVSETTEAATQTSTTAGPPARTYEYSFGIDLVVNIWGVSTEVCAGSGARFVALENVFASVFALNAVQVTCSCQLTLVTPLSGPRRLWHSSSPSAFASASSSSSSSSDSEERHPEGAERPEKIQKVIVGLRFDKKALYVRTLQRMLRHLHISDSSDSIEEELDHNIQGLNEEVGSRLSDALRKLVRVEILRISGNA